MNIPRLRFKEFNDEWKEKKLGDVSDIRDGTHDSPEYINQGYPLVTSKNISNGKIFFDNVNYISEEDYNSINKRSKVNKGDLLMGMIGTIGNLAIVNEEGFAIKNVALIKEKEILRNKFLIQLLRSDIFYRKLAFLNEGGTQKFISLGNIRNLDFNIPSLQEQQKIADFLSSVDRKIELSEEKLENFREYKKGVMQQIFSQELRFKDENGNDYPEWEENKLGEIGTTFNGLSGKTAKDFGVGEKYIPYKNIFDNSKIDINRLEFVSINENENQNKVEFGDIFFTVSSETPEEVGISSVLLDSLDDSIYLNSFCFGYRLNNKLLYLPHFFRYLLREDIFRKKVLLLAQGSTRYNISKNEMMKILVEIPSLPEQQKIANFLSSIDDKIEHLENELENLKEFKKGLLQQSFFKLF